MKRLLPLVLLVLLGIGCGSSSACPHGVELVLRAIPQHGEPVTTQGMQLVQRIIGKRVGTLGVGSPRVSIRGSDEIVVDLAGTHVPPRLARVVSVQGNLQIFDLEKDLAAPTVENGNPTPYPTLYSLLTAVKGAASGRPPEAYYLFGGSATHRVLQGPAGTTRALLAPYGGKQPAGSSILAVPPNREAVSGPVATASTRPVAHSQGGTYWYLFTLPAEIGGRDLKESTIQAQADPNSGSPEVLLAFTRHGSQEFQAITKAEYERGRLVAGLHGSAAQLNQLYAQHNAIVLDGKLQSAPYIDYTDPSLSVGIAGGAAIISNMGSLQAADNLALVLRTGSLPYRLVRVSAAPSCGR